jgi:hypothetical protein
VHRRHRRKRILSKRVESGYSRQKQFRHTHAVDGRHTAHWLARVYVEGCEPQRAEEIGELAVDLAIVAFQLAAPNLDTRGACRLDSQRGSAEKRVISEANGSYDAGRTRRERGSAIGPGRSRTS